MSRIQTLETPAGPAMLRRTDRKTLAISVLPDGRLELTAPRDVDVEVILTKVAKRSRWIAAQRRNFAKMNASRTPRRFVSGASHRYLGKQYRLKVSCGETVSVRLRGAYFHVATRTGSPVEIEKQLEIWFRERAAAQFSRRLADWSEWCLRRQLPKPRLVLRRMAKRWGSAGRGGRIALNPELIHAPSACIDYVIAHEICHLKHPLHDPRFFQLLSTLLPNWRELKERLERSMA